mmetsp:Transcript_43859/g.92246  ORF Transcript_43859/g.92246 Transcript_43859/m.92246 type:complete len:531 (+) Transcript_43859:158-1750(+)|eukprot:CAMPEP_0183730796 /NCGR_PEP_ID=MMETSP0737-20130205/33697_1 /TAXON_ID=385413 /ORGANISM="Thalassiosira miniscula, Strain CCMP1093" /LENGTH=530 /DNA_ID=CAMNT_0025963377 /DNA_START=83 /DNA_END=1675 /DNA_ORIENTATION=+
MSDECECEYPLTEGGILQLIESEGHFAGRYVKQPMLQIINIRRVPANALTDVYWAVLSDSENSIEVVISTHLSHLVQSGQLVEFTIIKIKTWQYNITDDNIHIVSISEIDMLEDNPEEIIGNPVSVSVLDSVHQKDVKDGFSYFNADDDEWDDDSDKEEPLTWSLDDPSTFCDWTIEVTRIQCPSSTTASMSRNVGRDKLTHKNRAESKPLIQQYHVHKAILSVGPRRSDYFATLFKQSHLSECATSTSHISLEDSAATAFPAILDYIYNDKKIKFSTKNATAIRHMAHYFGIRSLWKCASAYIRGDFSLETAATYLTESIIYHDEKLEHASIDILAERIEEINRRTLTKLPPASFERIVSSPKLKCRSKKLSDIVLKYCQTQGDAVDMTLLMKCTRSEVMPSVSRKAALPLLKVAVAEEERAGVNLSDTNNVLRARCVEACVEEWKETLAKPLLALESRDKNISRILGANSIEHRDLPLALQVELLEKALCAAKVELDDVKAELLYREDQVEKLLKNCKTKTIIPLSEC